MRFFITALAFGLVLLPSLLILLARHRPLAARLGWGLLAFLSPVVMVGLVQTLPALNNDAPDAAQWERFLGLILSGSGLILPWVMFALFLHRGDNTPSL